MNNKYFPIVERWSLPAAALHESIVEMSRDGVRGNEGVVLWLGRRTNGEAHVSHIVALRGDNVIKGPDQLILKESIFAAVTDVAIDIGVSLIGQIHSHGPGYGVDLSPTDRMYGVSVPYYLSLVAPDYAMRPNTTLLECGVHVLRPGDGFIRLGPAEIKARVRLTTEPLAKMIIVGEGRYA